jgi:hypothetical protein
MEYKAEFKRLRDAGREVAMMDATDLTPVPRLV